MLTSRFVANDKRDFLFRVNSIAERTLSVRQKATQGVSRHRHDEM